MACFKSVLRCLLQVLRQDRAPLLYSLVFGEGVINDATAVALLRAVQVAALAPLQRVPVTDVYVVMAGEAGISTSSINHQAFLTLPPECAHGCQLDSTHCTSVRAKPIR